MTITISNAYIQTFQGDVRHLAQQKQTKLMSYVRVVRKESESHRWDRLGAMEAAAKAGPRTATPITNASWSGRKTNVSTYDLAEVFEPEDMAQMIANPSSELPMAIAAGMNRRIDDIIIADAIGNALDQDGGNVALPSGQVIGDGSGEIDTDFILEVDEVFYSNDVDPDIKKCAVIGPKQRRKLLQLFEVTSGDFQNAKALATGYLPGFMGYDWIVSNRLNVPSSDELDLLFMTEYAIGLHIAKDIWVEICKRPDLSNAWQVYSAMSMDAVRVEDEHIVKGHVADTIT